MSAADTGAAPDGLVVVDKPGGLTSHDVVARIRRLAGTRRVGHAGTLDPMATGVLVLGVGRATRLLGHLTLTDKTYAATVRLGVTTTTDDADGEVVAEVDASGVDEASLEAALADLRGQIAQVPSSVSAIKVDGRRAYVRARAGEEVVLAARPVRVDRLEVVATRREGAVVDLDVEVDCSSGTYVRALARDLGRVLGVGGHLTALRRTRVGPYDLTLARTLDQLETEFALVPLATAAAVAFPTLRIGAETADRLRNGIPLPLLGRPGPVAVLDPEGELIALVQDKGPNARSLVVFPPAL